MQLIHIAVSLVGRSLRPWCRIPLALIGWDGHNAAPDALSPTGLRPLPKEPLLQRGYYVLDKNPVGSS